MRDPLAEEPVGGVASRMIELVEHGIGVVIGFEQAFDFAAQRDVVSTGLVEGGGAFVGVEVDDRTEEGADLQSALGG